MISALPPLGAASEAPLLAPATPSTGPGIADTLGTMAADAVDTMRAAETAASGAMTGEVTTREAVDRVMEAERTLRAAVAVRDKLVAGWLDVSRMQI